MITERIDIDTLHHFAKVGLGETAQPRVALNGDAMLLCEQRLQIATGMPEEFDQDQRHPK